MTMQGYFYELADALCAGLHSPEVLLIRLYGEESAFIRYFPCGLFCLRHRKLILIACRGTPYLCRGPLPLSMWFHQWFLGIQKIAYKMDVLIPHELCNFQHDVIENIDRIRVM